MLSVNLSHLIWSFGLEDSFEQLDFEQKLKHNNSIFFTGKTFRYLKFQKKVNSRYFQLG